jgi:hypothetical protein
VQGLIDGLRASFAGRMHKARLRPDDILARFEEVRRAEQLDESAAQMLCPDVHLSRDFEAVRQFGALVVSFAMPRTPLTSLSPSSPSESLSAWTWFEKVVN